MGGSLWNPGTRGEGGDRRQGGSWLLGPTGSCLLTEPILETGITKAPSWKGCVTSCRVMACGPILARSPISFGLENVLQIFKNEVIAHKNTDFWLCWRNPKGLATPGPHVLMTTSGGLSSSCPLLVFGLETPDLLIVQMGRLRPREGKRLATDSIAGGDPGLGLAILPSALPSLLSRPPHPMLPLKKQRYFPKGMGSSATCPLRLVENIKGAPEVRPSQEHRLGTLCGPFLQPGFSLRSGFSLVSGVQVAQGERPKFLALSQWLPAFVEDPLPPSSPHCRETGPDRWVTRASAHSWLAPELAQDTACFCPHSAYFCCGICG